MVGCHCSHVTGVRLTRSSKQRRVPKPACSRTTTSMFIPGLDGAFATMVVSSLLCRTCSVGTQSTVSTRTRIPPLCSYCRARQPRSSGNVVSRNPAARVAEFCRLRAGRDGLGTAVLLLLLLHGGGCGRAGAWRLPTLPAGALNSSSLPTRSSGACACGSILETSPGSSPTFKRWDPAIQSTVEVLSLRWARREKGLDG